MSYSERAKEIFAEEITELEKLGLSIDDRFDEAVELIDACHGKLVVMGIGKTGIIGHKIASSLASTGTPAIFSTSTLSFSISVPSRPMIIPGFAQ